MSRPLSTDKESNRHAHLGRWKRYYHLKRVFYLVYFRKVSLGYMRENYARLDEVLTECYLIGKWENGDVDQRKFTNSCGRFLWRRTRKKPQKLLMIPGGTSFLFRSDFFFIRSGEVLVDPAWESCGSCGSWPLLHPPPLLDLPILDLLLLDLLHREVVTLFHFSLTFQNIEKRRVNFLPLSFLRRLPEHLV